MTIVVSHQQKIGFSCPHCNGPMRTRTSRAVTEMYRQSSVACLDPDCGATYAIGHEITHQISPSAKPNPRIMIRTSPPRTRRDDSARTNELAPANDDLSGPEVPHAPANDDDATPAAEATGT